MNSAVFDSTVLISAFLTPSGVAGELIDLAGFKFHLCLRQKNEEFYERRAQIINRFTREFSEEFCAENGQTNWQKIIQLNPQARTKKAA